MSEPLAWTVDPGFGTPPTWNRTVDYRIQRHLRASPEGGRRWHAESRFGTMAGPEHVPVTENIPSSFNPHAPPGSKGIRPYRSGRFLGLLLHGIPGSPVGRFPL